MGACRKSGNRTRIAINRTHIAIMSTLGCSYSGDCVVSAAADGSVRIANLSHSPPLDTLMQRSLDYSTPGQPRHTAQPHRQSGAHGAGVVTSSMWLADYTVALSTQLPAGPPQQRPQSVSVRRLRWAVPLRTPASAGRCFPFIRGSARSVGRKPPSGACMASAATTKRSR